MNRERRDDEIEREQEAEAGLKGGAAAAYMPEARVVPAEREIALAGNIRWRSVWAGFVTAFGVQLLLGSLVFAIVYGVASRTGGVPSVNALGIWTAAIAFVAYYLAGMIAASNPYVQSRMSAISHSIVTWGLLLTLGTVAAVFGVRAVLGYSAGLPAAPIVGPAGRALVQIANAGLAGTWWFFIGAVVSLIGAMLGALSTRMASEQPTS